MMVIAFPLLPQRKISNWRGNIARYQAADHQKNRRGVTTLLMDAMANRCGGFPAGEKTAKSSLVASACDSQRCSQMIDSRLIRRSPFS
jgi:hypothetical protein